MEYVYNLNNLKRIINKDKNREKIKEVEVFYLKNFAQKDIPCLPYSKYIDYYKTGNRTEYERYYFTNRHRLHLLQILAVFDDKYISDLEDILAAICSEYTWILPAHNLIDSNRFDYSVIDLFASETGMCLAETVFVLGDKLCPDIKDRVFHCVNERIVSNFDSREYFWEKLSTNWSSVCASNVGLVYLYMFPEKFLKVESRIMGAFSNYLKGLSDDGYCFEGIYYWLYGFSFFCNFFDVYELLTDKRPEIVDCKKIMNVLTYPNIAYLGNRAYLMFGDGGIDNYSIDANIICSIKRLYGDKFSVNNVWFRNEIPERIQGFKYIYALDCFQENVDCYDFGTYYYKNCEVFVKKNANFVFTAKCNNFFVGHEHIDVGTFTIVKNGQQLIADVGAGMYTKDYFNGDRFGDKIFVCGSKAHCIPVIDGEYQQFGKNYLGQVISHSKNEFVIDIGKTYATKIESLVVDYVVNDETVEVKYLIEDPKNHVVVFHFVSTFKPIVENDIISINGMQIINKEKFNYSIMEKEYYNHNGLLAKAYIIEYKATGVNVRGNFVFKIN